MGFNLGANAQTADPGNRLGDIKTVIDAISNMQGAFTSNGLTASTTQTQAAATQLQYGINRVTSVANASDAIKMPQAKPGAIVAIVVDGGNTASLFPFLGDDINDAAVNASVSVADNTLSIYVCAVAGEWSGGAIAFET